MKKSTALVALVSVLLLCAPGCQAGVSPVSAASGSGVPASSASPVSAPAAANMAAVWESVSGSYVRKDSSQYNNAVLQMKYLSDNSVMFEFRLMEGSEAEELADTLVLPFVLLVEEDGLGHYSTLPGSANPFTLTFTLSPDGKQVRVFHTDDLAISPDGVYTFTNSELEVSEVAATAIIDHLPTAATSLNRNNGDYTLKYPEELVADWFYPVEAVFNDSGAVLAKFLVAKDLSAVYRADDDIEPVLIFGSAQPMFTAEALPQKEEQSDPGDNAPDWSEEPQPVVQVALEGGVNLTVGQESKLTMSAPWPLPYTLKAVSSNSSVVTVDESGKVKTVAKGTAILSGTLTVDDASKDFSIEVSVGTEG